MKESTLDKKLIWTLDKADLGVHPKTKLEMDKGRMQPDEITKYVISSIPLKQGPQTGHCQMIEKLIKLLDVLDCRLLRS